MQHLKKYIRAAALLTVVPCATLLAQDALTVKFATTFTLQTAVGANPDGNLIADANKNLYGPTAHGGASGAGTVYELTPPATAGAAWTESVLYSFSGGADGNTPY